MNYNQQQFMRMQQAQGLPFYMAYPLRDVFMTEMEYERDRERMKQLYPKEAKELQEYVEEECDKLEYEGSMMFDEYPDRMMLKMICDKIYQEYTAGDVNILDEASWSGQLEEEVSETMSESVESTQLRPGGNCRDNNCSGRPDRPPHRPGRPPHDPGRPPFDPGRPPHRPGRPPQNQGLENLIEVLLYNEMYKRRCRHNRCRQWW